MLRIIHELASDLLWVTRVGNRIYLYAITVDALPREREIGWMLWLDHW
jgi:hypothetical protein